jgi:hypothetical protein
VLFKESALARILKVDSTFGSDALASETAILKQRFG